MSNKNRSESDDEEIIHRDEAHSVSADAPAVGGVILSQSASNESRVGNQQRIIREWWFELQRRYHGYTCYGIFLLLPSDKEAIRYLSNFGVELDTISRNNCLLIFLGDGNFERPDINSKDWHGTVKRHVLLGGSAKIAQMFEIEYSSFPCLILFEDIRSARHVVVNLKDISADEISKRLRTIFSVIQKSIADKQDPLQALENNRNNENLQRFGKSTVSKVLSFAGKTMEAVMEAWVHAHIK